jgi:Site-specific DNA methylase
MDMDQDISAEPPRFFAVDFFCGAGGTTRGMIDAGGHVLAGVDKAAQCRLTYESNNVNADGTPARFLERDIFEATEAYPDGQKRELVSELEGLVAEARRSGPAVPLLFAVCAPCQPFTGLARKTLSRDREDARARDRRLLLEAGSLVVRFRPEIVLSENVAGASSERFGGVWGEFAGLLQDAGYIVGTRVVSTEKFGIAQSRRRSILVAVRADVASEPAARQVEVPGADPASVPVTVRDVLGKYPPLADGESHPDIPNHRAARLTDLNRRRLSHAKPGETNEYLWNIPGEDLALACHKKAMQRNNGVHKTFKDVYTRLHPDRPAPTITTNCHSVSNGRFGHYDPAQVRGISFREAAALQSFRDDYVFHPADKNGAVARMIGNAVPPVLARFFADFAVGLLGEAKR